MTMEVRCEIQIPHGKTFIYLYVVQRLEWKLMEPIPNWNYSFLLGFSIRTVIGYHKRWRQDSDYIVSYLFSVSVMHIVFPSRSKKTSHASRNSPLNLPVTNLFGENSASFSLEKWYSLIRHSHLRNHVIPLQYNSHIFIIVISFPCNVMPSLYRLTWPILSLFRCPHTIHMLLSSLEMITSCHADSNGLSSKLFMTIFVVALCAYYKDTDKDDSQLWVTLSIQLCILRISGTRLPYCVSRSYLTNAGAA